MPEYGLGFWQCKLRYQTPEEVLQVARRHKSELGLPMDVIAVDFFHWPKEGEWKFDPTYWPDPGELNHQHPFSQPPDSVTPLHQGGYRLTSYGLGCERSRGC